MSESKIEENNKKQDSSETKMDEPIESSEKNIPNEEVPESNNITIPKIINNSMIKL